MQEHVWIYTETCFVFSEKGVKVHILYSNNYDVPTQEKKIENEYLKEVEFITKPIT
jgi:hypothetical protein